MTKYNTSCTFYLVVEKFTEIFHIHFAFICIDNRSICVKLSIYNICVLNSFYNITQLADT